MLKTLLHYRNADSTLDLNSQLSDFFKKGLVTGGEVLPSWPNSIPQVTVAPFKLMGQDGMVVIETSVIETLTLPVNQTSVVGFQSQYVDNADPLTGYVIYEISVYNALSTAIKNTIVIFATVVTTTATALPVVSYDLRDVVDPVSRNTLRGLVSAVVNLPATNNRIGDAYIVESGVPDPNNGLYVWKGVSSWVNITDSLTISNILAQHRSNLFANEIHLTNAQAAAALGTSGSPSASNPYVTSNDPRVPTQPENDALIGLSQAVLVAPSSTNPYVTSAYNLAEPFDAVLSGVGAYITLTPGQGPFYVGMGVGAATALPYFAAYDQTLNREYLNSVGDPIVITGVYKSLIGPTPLNPAAESTVLNSNGFWSSTIYLSYTGSIDTNIRIRYGKQLNLQNMDRGLPLKAGPQSAQTSAETLARMAKISGRLMDDPMLAGEDNVSLATKATAVRRYLNTTTAADLVVPGTVFPHLRKISDLAADFPENYGDIAEPTSPTNANYDVQWKTSDVSSFDLAYTEDVPNLAVIAYASGTILPAVQPGWMFVDDEGKHWRILAYNGFYSLLIYTGGLPVNINNASGNQAQIIKANNPRRLEILEDFQTSMYREFFTVDDILPIREAFEYLPPGGVSTGTFIPANNFTLVGQSILPNQGSATGCGRGRPMYNLMPSGAGDRIDPRVVLVGNWKSDQTNYPRQAVGDISQGSLGIEFTGRLSSMVLWTSIRSTMPYGFRVFIDGVYTHSASQFLSSAEIQAGLVPSNMISALRGTVEKQLQPLIFSSLGLSDSLIHTVRIEVTQAGTADFPLYGVETFYNAGLIEAKGRGFTSTDFLKIDTESTNASPIISASRGSNVVRYLDRTLHTRQVASVNVPAVYSSAFTVTAVATVVADAVLANSAIIGDVFLFTNRSNTQVDVTTNHVYRRIVALDRNAGTVTLDSATGFAIPGAGVARAELVFRVPAAANGTPVLGETVDDQGPTEVLARFVLADWAVGSSGDVAGLSTSAADTRVTVLDDGSTSLSVQSCRQVSTGIEGFPTGARFESLSSVMVISGWGTGMDVVFSGSDGTACTIQIEIDGLHSYQISLANDGLARHTLFFEGAPQTHTVKIYSPSIAAKVVISQWIFHGMKLPAVMDGTPICSFDVPRNATSASSSYFDFAASASTNPLVVGNCGLRVFDISKYGARYYNGTTGSFDWIATQDFVNNPRFGYVMSTDRLNAIVEVQTVGTHIEIFYVAGPNHGIVQFYIDGVVASSGNCTAFGTGYNSVNGQVDQYNASVIVQRFIITNLSMGPHTVRMQNTGTKNVLSSAYSTTISAAAENPGTMALLRRHPGDTQINRLHMSGFRDLRQFFALTMEQAGAITLSVDQASELSQAIVDAAVAATLVSVNPIVDAKIAASVALLDGVIVGSAAQVLAGKANYSTMAAALGATAAGDLITVLRGSYAESVVLSSERHIRGQGRNTVFTGSLTVSSNYSSIKDMKFGGNIAVNLGATGNVIDPVWIAIGQTYTDSGTDTVSAIIGETV
jgi:hypothetical protein